MPFLPVEPLSLVGFGLIAATVAVLLFTDWPKAYTLGAASIVLFGLQFLDQAFGAGLGLSALALRPAFFLGGDWWTIVTYAFLHGGLLHIFGNLFILLTAGPALEDSVGPNWFLTIYAAGALAAAGAGVGLAYVDPSAASIALPGKLVPMVGSSGAIFAVLTAFAVRHPREKLPIPFYIIIWLPSMMVLLLFLAMNLGYIFLETNVAWYGHFAGFIVGLAIASLPIAKMGTASPEAVDVDTLRGLATTDRGRDAVERLEQLDPGESDVAEAWLDVLAEDATCPVCGDPLHREGLALTCEHGHDLAAVPERWTNGGPPGDADAEPASDR